MVDNEKNGAGRGGSRGVEQVQASGAGYDEFAAYQDLSGQAMRLGSQMDSLILRPAACTTIEQTAAFIRKPTVSSGEKPIKMLFLTGSQGNGKSEVLKGLEAVAVASGAKTFRIDPLQIIGNERNTSGPRLNAALNEAVQSTVGEMRRDTTTVPTVFISADEVQSLFGTDGKMDQEIGQIAGAITKFYDKQLMNRKVKVVLVLASRFNTLPSDIKTRATELPMPGPNKGERMKAVLDYVHRESNGSSGLYSADFISAVNTVHDDKKKTLELLGQSYDDPSKRNGVQILVDAISSMTDGWSYRDIADVSAAHAHEYKDTYGESYSLPAFEDAVELRQMSVNSRPDIGNTGTIGLTRVG